MHERRKEILALLGGSLSQYEFTGSISSDDASLYEQRLVNTAGKFRSLIDQFVPFVLKARQEDIRRLSYVFNEQFERQVRIVIERSVLGPALSRLRFLAMQAAGTQEVNLRRQISMFRNVTNERLGEIVGVSKRFQGRAWIGATASLTGLEALDFPSAKLDRLLQVKDLIFEEALVECGVDDMAADEFLPNLCFCIIRSKLEHPWSSTLLLRKLVGDDYVNGEAAYYLTTLEIALGHVLQMKLPADVVLMNAGGGGYANANK